MTNKAKEYAEALFLLSMENGEIENTAAALETVTTVLAEQPDYVEFLSSPAIPKAERTAALGTAFAALPESVVSFLQLLCERGRMREWRACADEFAALCRKARRMTTATVTSAVALTAQEREQLNEKLNAMSDKTVTVTWVTDTALLGGIIVEMDGKVLDGSLRRRLQEVKEVMEQ